MKRADDFETRRQHLRAMSDEELKAYFWKLAQQTVDRLVALGVRGFWNFTNREVTSDNADVRFESVHFADSLLTLSYHISRQ